MKHILRTGSLILLIVTFIQPLQALGQTACVLPKTDKEIGARGADVKCLQEFLINRETLAAGYNTGYFGPLTKAALGKFQAANNIKPSTGYWGPKTRAFAKSETPLVIAPVVSDVAPIFLPPVVSPNETANPTGPVPTGTSAVVLAKIKFHASGEAVKIKFIDVTLTQRTSPTEAWTTTVSTFTDDFANLRIVDDVGGQLGNSISVFASDGGAGTTGQCTVSSTVLLICHFGTSASPINYTVPANTTRSLSIISDIGASTDLDTVAAGFAAGTDNMEGQTSFVSTLDSGAVTGAARTVVASSLTATVNSAFSSPSYGAGLQEVKIASFILTASAAQEAHIYSLTFDKDTNADFDLQNMVVKIGDAQLGSIRTLIGNTEASLSFSASQPIVIPAGGSITVDVYADLMATSVDANYASAIDLIGWSANGSISGGAITFPGAVAGQTVIVSSNSTLTLSLSSNSPSAKQVVMGTKDVTLAVFHMTADSADDVYASDLTITDTMTNGSSTASFENLTLWVGDEMIGGPVIMTVVSGEDTGLIVFELLGDGIYIPKHSSTDVTLRGDVVTLSDGAAANSRHVFTIADDADIAAFPANPVGEATVTGAPVTGNTISVYRTKLVLSGASVIGSASNRNRAANDDVAQFTFNNIGNDQLTISLMGIKFQGIALSGAIPFNASLLKSDNTAFGSVTNPRNCITAGTNMCYVTSTPGFVLSPGQSQTLKIRVDSTGFFNYTTGGSESLSIFINATTDVQWNDGTTGSIPLEASVVPFTIVDVTYN